MENDLINPDLRATKLALDRVSDTFCAAKWLQTTLHLHNGNTQSCHHVRAHAFDPAKVDLDPQALHNTPDKLRARARMLAGKRPRECSYCWAAEDRGRLSDRVLKSAGDWARPHIEEAAASGQGTAIAPRYVEVAFDSTCNFRCVYCSPAHSTTWRKEIEQFGAYPTSRGYNGLKKLEADGVLPVTQERRLKNIKAFWRWWPELGAKIQDFRVTGGEPFLAEETFTLLDWFAAHPRPDLNFAINSNMGVGASRLGRAISGIRALHGRVRNFTLYTSLDSVGARAEYIRFGLDFARFQANTERVLNEVETPITLSYMITVNALSLSGLTELMGFILEQRQRHPRHGIALDTPYLQNPAHLSVGILTPDFISYLDRTLDFMKRHACADGRIGFYPSEIVKVDRIRDMLLKPRYPWLYREILRRDFAKMMDELDRRRRTSFPDTFPEYAEFRRRCSRALVGLNRS
ncbi:MAG TPA: twitch domain-containing radical SAM protein [Bdellovibrionales bacterium]|nr:twitch domain-containing radical SAM protein [Bdellovibrionales bacterium]